jgi:hypothetical protein
MGPIMLDVPMIWIIDSKKHSKGDVISTKQRLPVEIWTFIVFNDKYRAYNFEKYLKSGSGRAFMNKRFV